MKVLIDTHMVGQNDGGNERYMKNITLALAKTAYVGAVTYSYVNEFSHIRQHILPNNDLWRLLYVPFLMKKYNYTHYLSSYTVPFIKPLGIKFISILHDVYYARNPSLYSLKDRILFSIVVPQSLNIADGIVVPSNFIRSEVKDLYKDLANKSHVVYEGVDLQLIANHINKKKQIVVISSKNNRKNVDLAVCSFVNSGLSDYSLILVGKSEKKIKCFNHKNIHIRGYVSDLEMKELYASSACLLYLSDYEGFGLPVIEALANRTQVIVLDTPINREISRNKATFVKKKDPIYIGKILRESVKHKVSQVVARQIIKEFSWDKAARELLAVFKSV